jgi:hypothetical protein
MPWARSAYRLRPETPSRERSQAFSHRPRLYGQGFHPGCKVGRAACLLSKRLGSSLLTSHSAVRANRRGFLLHWPHTTCPARFDVYSLTLGRPARLCAAEFEK